MDNLCSDEEPSDEEPSAPNSNVCVLHVVYNEKQNFRWIDL